MQNTTGQMSSEPKQRTQAWLDQRKGRVTGSVAGAILGRAPYATRDDILRRMVRDYHGAESEFQGNIATKFGEMHEAGAIIDFRLETGLDVEEVGFLPYEDWLGASPDGMTSDGGVLEVKVPFSKRKDETPIFKPLSDQPHYYAQVQIEMLCAGRGHAWFFQWAPNGSKLERVKPDQAWRDENLPKLRQFHAEYLDAIKAPDEHLKPRRVHIDTAKAALMLQEWDDLAEAIERAEARKKALMEEFVLMAGNGNAEICGRKLTLVQKDGAISYAKAVKELAPDADLEKWRGKTVQYWKLG